MKKLFAFWKKDFLNKLILLVALAIVVGVGVNIYLLTVLTPQGLYRALVSPTPRYSLKTPRPTLTPRSQMPVANTETSTMTQPPTTLTQQPTLSLPTQVIFTPSLPPPSTATLALVLPTFTPFVLSTPTATAPPIPTNITGCIPAQTPESGSVLEVLDGNTLRVLFKSDGRVYTVRYIGIDVPPYDGDRNVWGRLAYLKNNTLTYSKSILMFKDGADKDDRGRFLRYVTVGDLFANFEMLRTGNATALASTPAAACDALFRAAEAAARQAGLGQWLPTPTTIP